MSSAWKDLSRLLPGSRRDRLTDGLEPQPAPPHAEVAPERRLLRVLVPAMFAAVALAVLVNWLTAPPIAGLGMVTPSAIATRYEPGIPAPTKKPISQLPSEILAYETIARQAVPGKAETAAEAVYVTLNVNLEMQLAMSVYARAEAFASAGDASAKQAEIMAEFPRDAKTTLVGPTVARTGFNADQTAYAVTWVRDGWVTFVKTTFKDHPPAQRRVQFLTSLTAPVISAVDTYQRTGKEGIQLGAQRAAENSGTRQPPTGDSGVDRPVRPPGVDAPGGLGF